MLPACESRYCGRIFFAWANADRDEEVWAAQYDAQDRVVAPAGGLGEGGGGEFKVSSYTGNHHLHAHGAAIDDTGRLLEDGPSVRRSDQEHHEELARPARSPIRNNTRNGPASSTALAGTECPRSFIACVPTARTPGNITTRCPRSTGSCQ